MTALYSRVAGLLAVLALLGATAPPGCAAYQILLSNEDPAFSVKSGAWALDKTGTFLRTYKFSAPGPGTGASQAVWTIDGIPAGTYDVEFYVDNGNYAAAAEYIVESDTGVTTVTRSQYYVGTGWRPLGTFSFTYAGRITQTDRWTGAGTKVIADTLRLTLHGPPVAPTLNVDAPAISICIDDLGALNPADPLTYTAQLFAGAPNFAYAVLPAQPHGGAVLNEATARGIETLFHQPMQYIGQSDTPSDPLRLYVSLTDAQILSILRSNLNAMTPHVIGVNNHQGSRFSQYARGMAVVAGELAARKLFYLDSRTIADSVGYDEAKRAGILAAERDLFVDGNTTAETVAYVRALAERALYAPNYPAIGIGHQRPNTVPGVLQALNDLQASGVAVRRLSRAVSYMMEVGALPAGGEMRVTGTWIVTPDDMIARECHDTEALASAQPGARVEFVPDLPLAGWYRVFVGYGADPTNCPNANVTITSELATRNVSLNQSLEGNRWHYLGRHPFRAGTGGHVRIEPDPAHPTRPARADCVKFTYDGPFAAGVGNWTDYRN